MTSTKDESTDNSDSTETYGSGSESDCSNASEPKDILPDIQSTQQKIGDSLINVSPDTEANAVDEGQAESATTFRSPNVDGMEAPAASLNNVTIVRKFVEHPLLKKNEIREIRKWSKLYDRYLLDLSNNPGQLAQDRICCIDMEILQDIAELDFSKSITELSEKDIMLWIKQRITTKEESMDDLYDLMSEWKMDLRKEWGDRVPSYFRLYRQSLQQSGLEASFESEELRRKKVYYLLKGVRPARLREVMKLKHAQILDKKDTTSVSVFFNLLQKWNDRAALFLRTTNFDQIPKASVSSKRKASDQPERGKKKRVRGRPTRLDTKNTGSIFRELRCWVEGCTGRHKIKDHPNVTPEQQARAFERLNEHKNKKSSNYPALTSDSVQLNSLMTQPPLLENEVLIENCVRTKYCLDTGAERTCISADLLTGLNCKREQSTPVKLQLAVTGAETGEIVSDETVYLDVILNTKAGPLKLRKVETLVINGPMNCYILGDQHLKQLGIDVEDLVANRAGQIIDMSEEQAFLDNAWPGEIPFGERIEEDISQQLEAMLSRAQSEGADVEQTTQLRQVIYKWKHVWRTKLGPDPPAKVPPLKVKMLEGTRAFKGKGRRTGPMQSEFLKRRVKELESFGYLYLNPNSRCAHPVHVVKKLDVPTWANLDDAFRWTGDFRQQNAATDPLIWPMPNLEVLTNKTRGCNFFQTFDAFKGFWQLPLDPASQEYFSFITDTGVYTPTRVPQGCCDAVMYFQSTMQHIFQENFNNNLLIWLDDILGYNLSFPDLIQTTDYILGKCSEFGLFLNPKKTTIFTKKVKFCGKILSASGVQHDPERTRVLSTMSEPSTAGELQQFLCAMNWIRDSLPDFPRNSRPLRDKLEHICQTLGKRTKNCLKHHRITFTDDEALVFNKLRQNVTEALLLVHPDPEAEFGLFCDASDSGWGSILLQIKNYDDTKPWSEQKCEPLYCLGGNFRGASSRWKIIEKEAFAIRESVERLDYLLTRPKGFRIYTDHRNLQYIFSHDSMLKKTTKQKLERWAMFLMGFRYTIEHIEGLQNTWADLLSRWAAPPRPAVRQITLALHPLATDADFPWPSIEGIRDSQQAHPPTEDREDLYQQEGVYYRNSEKHLIWWIPEEDVQLQTRLLITAHFGLRGHRGISATLRHLQFFCYWRRQSQSVTRFCTQCLHCLQSRGGRVIPRPFGRQMHADAPNKILHMDYLQLEKAHDGNQYVLVIKDDFSHLVHLVVTTSPDAATVAKALVAWFSEYRIVEQWVSDQGSHFKNQTIRHLKELLQTNHHFTTAYCPWANGTVERVNRDLLSVLRALRQEAKKAANEWPDLIPVVQFVLNHTAVESLGNKAPVEIHNGAQPSSALEAVFNTKENKIERIPPDTDEIKQHYKQLMESLTTMHKEAKEAKNKINKRKVREPKLPNFDIGDFVLWSQVKEIETEGKLEVIWKGPYRIVGTISEYVYEVEHLLTKQQRQAHITRLKFYHDPSLEITEELKQHIGRQRAFYQTDEIKQLRYNSQRKQWELLISWKGLEPMDDSWEPFPIMIEDITIRVIEFLRKIMPDEVKQVRAVCKKYKASIIKFAERHNVEVSDFWKL